MIFFNMLEVSAFLAIISIAAARPSDRRSTCGGIAGLNACGGFFPSDFCCPTSTQCLPVNASVVAVVCCPIGVDCRSLQPTTCDLSAYDANRAPLNQIHIQAAQNLSTCGSACCPPGYDCQGSDCIAVQSNASTVASPTTSNTATASSTSSAAAVAVSAVAEAPAPPSGFSGSSFAAGFVPGLVLGICLIIAILWIRRRSRSASVQRAREEQSPPALPPMISISQPAKTSPHRTDFLRSTSTTEPSHLRSSTSTDSHLDHSSAGSTDLRPMLDYDTGYSQPRSPSPALLQRALSFRFSPLGKLRNKQSMHSLRRHMDAQAGDSSIHRSDSSDSTGTIKVVLPPEESPAYRYPQVSESTRPSTPTRSSRFLAPQALGSPYTPSRYNDSFVEPRRSERRVTTFSSLMEKAGFRRRDFEDM